MTADNLANSYLPLAIVMVPLLCGVAVILTGLYARGAARKLFLASAAAPAILSMFLLRPVLEGKTLILYIPALLPPVGLSFRVDYLSLFMILLFSVFGLILFIYSYSYMEGSPNHIRFLGIMSLVLAGSLGVVTAGDLFTFFLFFEFMSVAFFILLGHRQTPESASAALKFLFMTILAGVGLFLGLTITYLHTGNVAFGQGGVFPAGTTPALAAFIGFILAFGIKSAVFPLHLWMPDAYTHSPVPAAAISSGVLLKTGVYGIIRIFYDIFGLELTSALNFNTVVLVLGCITILYGSLNAIAQDDLNRRLAYSGIAQIGYILIGISLLTPNAFIGNVYHIFAHAFMKGCLFLCAGAIIKATGKRKISELGGVGIQMPLTMLAFTIAAITAVGMPPFNVFITKWYLGQGALETGLPLLVLLLLFSSILNAAYYLPISYKAFLGRDALSSYKEKRRELMGEVSPALLAPIFILALACILFNVMPGNWPLELAKTVAGVIFNATP